MQNLLNKKYGKLKVIKYFGKNKFGTSKWLCKCDCGALKLFLSSNLPYAKSCGCIQRNNEIKIGQRFSKLIVFKRIGKNKKRNILYECICDCGNFHIVNASSLRDKQTQSCGCLQLEKAIKHNLYYNPIYQLFNRIKSRCYNKNHKHYDSYGGRGIKVCDEWLNDVSKFVKWAEKNGWKRGLQIDRKNNNGNYEPNNCRFVTSKVNNNNKRNSKIWYLFGKKYETSIDAAKDLGVCQRTIRIWCGLTRQNSKKENCYAVSIYGENKK